MLRSGASATLLAAAAALGVATAPAVAEEGPLPGGLAYEMVSPVLKFGNGVATGTTASPDGSAVNYSSSGAHGGAPGTVLVDGGLVSRRTETGWTTTSLTPLVDPHPSLMSFVQPSGLSEDLTRLFTTPEAVGFDADDQNGVTDVYVSAADRTFQWLTPGPALPETSGADSWYAGRSKDARTIVVGSSKQLVPGVPGGTDQVYALVDGVPRLVSAVDGETTVTDGPAVLGSGATTKISYFVPPQERAVSEDGSRVVFTTTTAPRKIHVRDLATNDTTTVSLSQKPGEVGTPAANPVFLSASADGSRIFFSTTSLLTNDATTNGGLYQYDLDDGKLTYLSTGGTGNVLLSGLVRASADGERVYFVARAQLNGEGTASTPNLYVARGGDVDLVATLASGTAEQALWEHSVSTSLGESTHPARINADGSRFLFATKAAVPGFATGGFTQVYLYDADADQLTCVSCRPDGAVSKGAASLLDTEAASQNPGERRPRNLIDDGDQALFETTDALVPEDADTESDVYLWDGTAPVLVSVGAEEDGVHLVDNSVDGTSIFLRTRASLLPEDIDRGESDIYVARVDGGFPSDLDPDVEPCDGDACRGPQTPAPGSPGAASAAFNGPGNVFEQPAKLPGSADTPSPSSSLAVKRPAKAALARWAASGRGTVKVTLGKAGTVRVVARAKVGGKQATVAQGTAKLKQAGSASVTLRLSAAARRALRRTGRLSVRLTVTSAATSKQATTTVVLRRAGSKR